MGPPGFFAGPPPGHFPPPYGMPPPGPGMCWSLAWVFAHWQSIVGMGLDLGATLTLLPHAPRTISAGQGFFMPPPPPHLARAHMAMHYPSMDPHRMGARSARPTEGGPPA